MLILQLLALAGFLASLLVHLAALAGAAVPQEAMALHLGVFLVFFPAVLLQNRLVVSRDRSQIWSELLRGCPGWVKPTLYLLFGYALLNFFRDFVHKPEPQASPFRMFSGHWMLFYFIAFAIIWSYRRVRSAGLRL